MGVMHYLPFCVSAYGTTRPETEEHTAERVVPIYLWAGLGVWTAGHPWELDVEAGMRGGCEVDVDAEGKQEGDCSEEGGHGGQRSVQHGVESEGKLK